MKRLVLTIAFLVLFSANALADSISSIIPDASLWGLSQDEFEETTGYSDLSECKVGKKKAFQVSDVEIDAYNMNGYYVFDEQNQSLSKVAFILDEEDPIANSKECYEELVEDMQSVIGEPESSTKTVTAWIHNGCKVQIGIGKFKNYTGSEDTSVGIIFTYDSKIENKETRTSNPSPSLAPSTTPIPRGSENGFSIRGGITFGMSPEEVSEYEEGIGEENEIYEDFINIGYRGMDSLAGIPLGGNNSDVITYHFDKSTRELKEISYWFGYYDYMGLDYYNELKTNLTNKYGTPDHDSDGSLFPSPTVEFTINIRLYNNLFNTILSTYCEWLVPYEDYNVLIDLFLIPGNSDQIAMGYKIVSYQEIAQYIVDKQEEQEKIAEQVDSDL